MNRVNVGGPLRAARCLYVPYMCDDVSAGVRQRRVIIRTSGSAPSRVAGGCSALRRGDLRGRGAATWRGILNRCQHVQRAASSRRESMWRISRCLWSKNAGASRVRQLRTGSSNWRRDKAARRRTDPPHVSGGVATEIREGLRAAEGLGPSPLAPPGCGRADPDLAPPIRQTDSDTNRPAACTSAP